MRKPIEKYPTGKMWIWSDIESYYREKFGKDMRHEATKRGSADEVYCDFWHVILDCDDGIRNGSVGFVSREALESHHRYAEDWCKQRVEWLFSEFDPEGTGELICWFSW